jgi:hypothetical protein
VLGSAIVQDLGAMPQWLKVVLLLAGAGIVGLCLLIGGGVWWVQKNTDRLAGGALEARAEGDAFGRAHSKDECVDDSLKHLQSCGPVDFMCEAETKMRLTSCLAIAKGESLCSGVPAPTEIFKATLWGSEACSRRGQPGSQACSVCSGGSSATARAPSLTVDVSERTART